MNSFDVDTLEASVSSCRDENWEEAEAVHQLLEEGWFYGELLNGRQRMLRCYSDPTPNFGQQSSANDKTPKASKVSGKLSRAPSIPPCIGNGGGEKIHHRKSNGGQKKLSRQLSEQAWGHEPSSRPISAEKKPIHTRGRMVSEQSKSSANHHHSHRLLRSPSLPHNFGREEEEDVIQANDSDITMSILIRQAMPNSWDVFPRRRNSLVMPKYKPPRSPDIESTEKTRPKCPNPGALPKRGRDFQLRQAHESKDLGLDFKKEELVPSVVERLPGLQGGKGRQDKDETRRGHFSAAGACHVQSFSYALPSPIWAPKTPTQDMKAQLKFWARAVASNVR